MGGRRISALGVGVLTTLLVLIGFAPAAHAGRVVQANPDTVHTTENTAVDFDPTTNDFVSSSFEVVSIDIESSPDHGTATINADKKSIHYVPDPGYFGPDTMEYNVHVCSSEEHGTDCTEDTGDISITVAPAPATTTTAAPTTTTITVAAEASTTVAPATTTVAPVQLPRTGSSSGPLTLVAVMAVGLGSLLLAFARRRRATS